MDAPHLAAAALLLAVLVAITWRVLHADLAGRRPSAESEADGPADAAPEGDEPKAA